MSHNKTIPKAKILEELERVASILPGPIYWEDVNSVILGGNEAVFKGVGAQVREAYVGKSLYQLYPYEMAEHIKLHNEEVMRTGKILSQEEPIKDITTGEVKYFTAIKAPLRDDGGNIIGIVGTSIDITAQKEAERLKIENLRLENEMQRQRLAEHERFAQLATQVVHDIRSPLAAMNTALKHLPQVPEQERIMLRSATQRINDIANNLLTKYKNNDTQTEANEKQLRPWLIAPIIESMVAEKRLQFEGLPIEIDTKLSDTAYCGFAKVELVEIKRVLSNIINNAAEAFPHKTGKIIVAVNVTDNNIIIEVHDNGCGIAPEKLPDIFKAKQTSKAEGTGLGLAHAKHAVERMNGSVAIKSTLNQGTTISIHLPKAEEPAWFSCKLMIDPDDYILILDDDESIHGAWDARLKPWASMLNIIHFQKGDDLIMWRLQNSTASIFVLSDYELLGEQKSGLDILEALHIGNKGALITSHYEKPEIIERCIPRGIALLPKNLVAYIPLEIKQKKSVKKYDAVLLDDDVLITAMWEYASKLEKKELAIFNTIVDLEKILDDLPHATPIYIDSSLGNGIKGEDYGKKLYERGFKTIYLATGHAPETFPPMYWISKIIGKEPRFF